jgi:alpha-D-xyloside xylohydrolase
MLDGLQYAQEKTSNPMKICIYEGADGEFLLYEDEGDNYNFENGSYTIIKMLWNDEAREFSLCKIEGQYLGMEQRRTFVICLGNLKKTVEYDGNLLKLQWN